MIIHTKSRCILCHPNVDTRDEEIGEYDEDSDNGRAIGDGEETIVKLDPCSLQQKVQHGLQSSDRD